MSASRVASPASESSSTSYISARSWSTGTSWADSFSGASSDDEVLLSFSDISSPAGGVLSERSALSPSVFSDGGDYILLSRSRSPAYSSAAETTSSAAALDEALAALSSLRLSAAETQAAQQPSSRPSASRFDIGRAATISAGRFALAAPHGVTGAPAARSPAAAQSTGHGSQPDGFDIGRAISVSAVHFAQAAAAHGKAKAHTATQAQGPMGAAQPPSVPTATSFDLQRAIGISAAHFAQAAPHGKANATPVKSPAANKSQKKAKAQQASAPNVATPKKAPAQVAVGAPSKKADKAAKALRKQERLARKAEKAMAEMKKAAAAAASTSSGLGERPIVDDVSEAGDHGEGTVAVSGAYQDARNFITTFLSSPTPKSGAAHLRLAQALIVELGLCPSALSAAPSASFPSLPALPQSLTSARALLKSRIFLNVRDYLEVRAQGLDALRRVMHPSKSALMREIRKGKRVPVKVVKDAGLNVLLITCF
ncbi:hypothetical protein WOLCODRAFT_136357 [Wolfiporia cocos MD-104 SS10]|uniref:Uncharacterized protein n=1 Tax=Wolfiporia cocos (strain MD-104) TaxID=742152 RepID=A0A2H3JRH6_WOLCO|nr:hypothetical protein WOLCODRAFT_136357 [Wolfiporia cocos MD-104 SS10]